MTDKIEIINCNDDDVISFNEEICKISKFRNQTLESFYMHLNQVIDNLQRRLGSIHNLKIENGYKEWFNAGKECELLQEGKRWQKGKLKIKLTLEFCPDEPEEIEENGHQEIDNITESPLDEIRQQLTDEN